MMAWLSRLIRGRQLERELEAELREHLERQVADHVRSGMSEVEARRQALIEMGGLEQVKEECRDVRGTLWLEQIGRDVAYAIRQLRRQPAFWSIVIATLVLGVATSTAVFAVVNGVLLRPLPYPDPGRLVSLTGGLGYRGEFVQLRQLSRTMDIGAHFGRAPVSLTGRGGPVRLDVALASSELFDVLRVDARNGRRFLPEDTRPGARPVVLLGYGLWQQRFGGDLTIVGQQLTLDGVAHTVVGVMPVEFRLPEGAQLWLPLVINPADRIDLWANGATMIGRLRANVRLEQAKEEVRALAPSFRELFPWKMQDDYGKAATVIPLQEQIVGDIRPTLLVLLGSVATVLLILCVNVANLLLTRGLSRERELAIRTAIGATRERLVRQLLIESLTVALLAGTLAIAATFALVELTLSLLPADVPRVDEITLDGRVLAFALGMSILTGLLFGILPAIRASKWGDRSLLRTAGSKLLHVSERRTSRLLVAAELALAVILVVSAALLIKTLWNLMAVDPGFRAGQLVTANVAPPRARYGQPAVYGRFVDDLLTRLRGVPGVRSAAAGTMVPFAGRQYGGVFSIEGRPDPATQTGDWPTADVRTSITAEYLQVLGVPILEGRPFTETDSAGTTRVTLVSQSLARAYWGTTSPVGARVRLPGGPNAPWMTIVGVVADVKWNNLGEERNWATGALAAGWLRTLYIPVAQTFFFDNNGMRILLRTERDVQQITANLRGVVGSLDKDIPVSDIRTSEALIAESVSRPRFTALLLAIFASVALFLGAIGVYGVLAYAVGRRQQEFAVRLALGADTRDVLRGVIAEGARLTIAGVGLGIAGALVTTRALSRLLFGVQPTDPGVLAGVALVLVAIGLLASYLPARRAMRVDPVTALQAE